MFKGPYGSSENLLKIHVLMDLQKNLKKTKFMESYGPLKKGPCFMGFRDLQNFFIEYTFICHYLSLTNLKESRFVLKIPVWGC